MIQSRFSRFTDLISTHLILGFFALIAIFPVLYTLMTSFKTQEAVLTSPPSFFPSIWALDGYQTVFNSDMVQYYIPNTFINSLSASLMVVLIASLSAYTFSRYRFRGSRVLEISILGLIMVPFLTHLVPLYRAASQLRMLNSHIFIILVYSAGNIPFAIWIIRSFFDSIPYELEEAAMIDGANAMQTLRYVVVPLALPGLMTAFLLVFVNTWNEFLAAIVLLSGTARTATVGLYDFQSSFQIAYHVWTAASILIMVPVLVVFLLLRRTFFKAMLQGALKG